MTKHECAVITAYTDISMLEGDDLKYLYDYLSGFIDRPIYTHEIPAVCMQFKEQINKDFVALCRNATDTKTPVTIMTRSEQAAGKEPDPMTLREEMEEAMNRGQTFIPPHKLGEMARIAAKIVRMLTENASGVTFGYEDMGIILRIVQSTLDAHIQEEKEDKPCTACCKTKVL